MRDNARNRFRLHDESGWAGMEFELGWRQRAVAPAPLWRLAADDGG
jgi:hypothetical protein